MKGLDLLAIRLNNQGGASQQARMIKDKRRTLDRVLLYSYQGADVRKLDTENSVRALITPNQLKQDYDEKILSIGFEHGYHSGDVIEWVGTNTKWLIYMTELTELAYMRSSIRRCSFAIAWKDEDGNLQKTYAAIVGPESETISSIAFNNNSMDIPNYKIHLILPQTEEVTKYFVRYSKFFLKDLREPYSNTCWRVEAVNAFNSDILEIYAMEYYANEHQDDIENGIVDGLIEEPIPEASQIEGDGFIRPYKFYTFIYNGEENSDWSFLEAKDLPIETQIDGKTIQIKWLKTYSGQFTLQYGLAQKTIVVESLY